MPVAGDVKVLFLLTGTVDVDLNGSELADDALAGRDSAIRDSVSEDLAGGDSLNVDSTGGKLYADVVSSDLAGEDSMGIDSSETYKHCLHAFMIYLQIPSAEISLPVLYEQ